MTGFDVLLSCLALNIYKEARGEDIMGQYAVALVTLNRAREKDGDICRIVFTSKQFSWTETDSVNGVLRDDKMPSKESKEWKQAIYVAQTSFAKKDFTNGATHFHSIKIHPYWVTQMNFHGKFGSHYFYKSRKEEK